MNYHLVILKKPYLDAVLNGRKRIESRFGTTKRPVFGQVLPGDTLFFKLSAGPVCATATVAAVENFDNLTPQKMLQLKLLHNRCILGTDEYWQSKLNSRFGLLVWLKDVRPIEPVRIQKKDWRAWVVLTPSNNFGLLKRDTVKQPP
jgi:ASC-1-like (ASCH) protein